MAPGLILNGTISADSSYKNGDTPSDNLSNGDGHPPELNHNFSNGHNHAPKSRRPSDLLRRAPDTQVHDLVCVGFGPASLAVAIALHDSSRAQRLPSRAGPGQDYSVRFLERQGTFGWHAGMLLPGAKMQISFIKDLATLRDPCSHFTFLNYLKQHNRLVSFSNLGTFLPSRLEFADYMKWAASHFEEVVDYSTNIERIIPHKSSDNGKVEYLKVESYNSETGKPTSMKAHNVVIAVGGRPTRPPAFPAQHPKILHSSQYSTRIGKILPTKEQPYSIAIVGSGQSAAELFNDLHSRYPNAKTRLILRDSALRPSDDSPFVNEVFNPEAVDTFYDHPANFRKQELAKCKSTNYSVVRLELLEKIYEAQYEQSITQPDKSLWQHQILPLRDVMNAEDIEQGRKVQLTLRNLDPLHSETQETHSVDAVVLATGYARDVHNEMLKGCESLNASADGRWHAGRDYRVSLKQDQVEPDVGIWLQGCNEETHGISDTLLSILATRSDELVNSMFKQDREKQTLCADTDLTGVDGDAGADNIRYPV